MYPPAVIGTPPPSPPTPQSPGPKGLGLFLWRHGVFFVIPAKAGSWTRSDEMLS